MVLRCAVTRVNEAGNSEMATRARVVWTAKASFWQAAAARGFIR
jgi:hypothetical protein